MSRKEPFHLRPAYKVKYVKEKQKLQHKLAVQLKEDFKNFFEAKYYTDLKLLSCEGHEFPVHKTFLAARCPRLLDRQDNTPSIELKTSHDNMEQFCLQLYSSDDVNLSLISVTPDDKTKLSLDSSTSEDLLQDLSFEEVERICHQSEHHFEGHPTAMGLPPSTAMANSSMDHNASNSSVQGSSFIGDESIMGFQSEISELDACCQVGQELVDLYIKGTHTDLTIKAGTSEYRVHRAILISRSVYFEAMLGGKWIESNEDIVTLEKVNPLSLQQALLYMYGGVVDLVEGCSAFSLVQLADMLGLAGLKSVASFQIQKNYCHFFHKPICQDCIAGICEILPLVHSYNIADLKTRCIECLCKNYVKVWPTKGFILLPADVLEEIKQAKTLELKDNTDISEMLEAVLYYKNIYNTMTMATWANTARDVVCAIYEDCIQHFSTEFSNVIVQLRGLVKFKKLSSWSLLQWEEVLSTAIESMTPELGIDAFKTMKDAVNFNSSSAEPQYVEVLNDYKQMVDQLLEKCQFVLTRNMQRLYKADNWSTLDEELQAVLSERASFVPLGREIKLQQRSSSPFGGAKPKKLTVREIMSGTAQSSRDLASQRSASASPVPKVQKSKHNVSSAASKKQVKVKKSSNTSKSSAVNNRQRYNPKILADNSKTNKMQSLPKSLKSESESKTDSTESYTPESENSLTSIGAETIDARILIGQDVNHDKAEFDESLSEDEDTTARDDDLVDRPSSQVDTPVVFTIELDEDPFFYISITRLLKVEFRETIQ